MRVSRFLKKSSMEKTTPRFPARAIRRVSFPAVVVLPEQVGPASAMIFTSSPSKIVSIASSIRSENRVSHAATNSSASRVLRIFISMVLN